MTNEERQLWRLFAASCMNCGLIRDPDLPADAAIEMWMCSDCEQKWKAAEMKSYSERKVFDTIAQAIWADAVDLVRRVSDHRGDEVRCHELARAARSALGALNQRKLDEAGVTLGLVDGQLWSIEHTWLTLTRGSRQFILDVYTPGRLPQVQLLDGDHFVIGRGYTPGVARRDIDALLFGKLLHEMQT